MRRGRHLVMAGLVLGFGLAAVPGCREPGPAEKAGKAIDDAVDDAQHEADEAKKKMAEALE